MTVSTMNSRETEQQISGRFPYAAEKACYAIIWVKSVASDVMKKGLVEELTQRDDILDARYTQTGPLCLVVKYDGLLTSPSEIQERVNRPGIRAVIVGC